MESAAKVIERDGWHQRSYYKIDDPLRAGGSPAENRSAPCCQAGAISRATWGVAWLERGAGFRTPEEQQRWTAMYAAEGYTIKVVSTMTAGRVKSPIAWNDEADRTKEDVVAMLRTAAEKAREAGE